MEDQLGLLRIHILRGINLAVRDLRSSDPYVVVRMAKQKLKTRVVKKNVNPEWNEELTLCIAEPILPIKLQVYDKDTFSRDDKMGDAELDIVPFIDAVRLMKRFNNKNIPNGAVIAKIMPSRQNCYSEESCIVYENGKVVQYVFLRLRNVECGEIELRLQWIDIPSSRLLLLRPSF